MEVAIFSPKINERYRILVYYDSGWRPILWFQVKKDGSIYLGPRYEHINKLRWGSAVPIDGKVNIKYNEGTNVVDPEIIKNAGKTSFHASGTIHAAGRRSFRENLRAIQDQQLLCLVLFWHLSRFKSVDPPTSRDICLRYPVDEKSPLQCLIYISPTSKHAIHQSNNLEHQVALVLPYSGFDSEMQDVTLQIILGHGAKGAWPPDTYLVYPTKTAQT